ncbi:glycosyltransferase (plasmid) [Nocardia sp. NBC_01377]|uniref:glycosyltransferase n=1 Tax=Nocardia sp. NBC_01377 TaxID=2903595 RepID=UPI002F9126CF
MSVHRQGIELLQRVIFPRPGEPLDVRALYQVEAESNPGRAHALSRTSVLVSAESEVSFETYFNAFAAAYWRRWSVLPSVVVRVEVRGACRVDVYRSKADGSRIAVLGDFVTPDESGKGVFEAEIDLAPFEDGGWIWFDLTTETEVTVLSAGWYSPIDPPDGMQTRRVAVGMPTFNRPADAVATLMALSSDPQVAEVIDVVLVPDQGDRLVSREPGFDVAAEALGDKLRIFRQPNLGGSGGYGRIMYEAIENTDSPFILYMDDDIMIEPDSILRALAFGRYARNPIIVGGQMLNLQERSHLHSMGEVVDRGRFMWTSAPNSEYDHDFARYPLRDRDNSANLHRRVDVDYNGWWTCLIPREVAERIGQPLPFFLKWEDVEYGLRARAAGHRTVSVPGIAVWHMAWSDKDDAIDWQAYFHLRNRLIVAALYHDGPHRPIVVDSIKALVKHLICLEYSTVHIQMEAIRDFLAGPDHLWELLSEALPKVRGMRRDFPDAMVLDSAADLPSPTSGRAKAFGVTGPRNPLTKIAALAEIVGRNLFAADDANHEAPQANYTPVEARWFSLGRVDGATVTTADGRGVVFRKRDRAKAAALLRQSLALHRELDARFPELQTAYRAAHSGMTSRSEWKRLFDAHSVPDQPPE